MNFKNVLVWALIILLSVGLFNLFQDPSKRMDTASNKIAFSKSNSSDSSENPVKFIETFFFQFLNPKAVIVAIIIVSTYVDSGENFINHSLWVLALAFIFACFSIFFWSLVGKFLRKFATNEKFIKRFNYVMSFLLLTCIVTFYL